MLTMKEGRSSVVGVSACSSVVDSTVERASVDDDEDDDDGCSVNRVLLFESRVISDFDASTFLFLLSRTVSLSVNSFSLSTSVGYTIVASSTISKIVVDCLFVFGAGADQYVPLSPLRLVLVSSTVGVVVALSLLVPRPVP